ncbi:hypothetical protein DZF91_07760 [Actinomadura logoneensis]|uniref:Cysteinyl-tRNA synthetase n=1 Tax=Actinomadura logoneensis TaxID=2293572 RepID=A0A372JR03_9ACTN|nr:hypothetical protein [Actinomadura logoneensis]RFU42236.1 hypothetical protein DZF91_07760 [Actinomadura logoneensis]
MLRLHDPRTGRLEEPPRAEVLRVHVLAGTDLRGLVVADLLRRLADRRGRRVLLSGEAGDAGAGTGAGADAGGGADTGGGADAGVRGDLSEYGVGPLYPDAPERADLYVAPRAHEADAWTLVVPPASGSFEGDPLAVRLAFLSAHYREPLHADVEAAEARLRGWRADVAEWANAPGRPMHRPSAAEAEAALADDLDTPAALAVLDRIASDASLAPGAKLETFIHLDLLLGLNVVADIGRTG